MNDKWGKRFFKTGSLTLILLALVHCISLFTRPVAANETEKQLMDLMANYRITVMGSVRTMNDFLRGFSISFALAALGLGVLDLALWHERAGLLKKVALCNVLWLAAMTVVSLRYFFAVPTSFLLLALMIFAAAWIKLTAVESSQA